jgi:hypothetical protein
MKWTFYILALVLGLLSRNNKDEKAAENNFVIETTDTRDTIKLHKLEKLFIVGDFDGNGVKDTIFEHNFSRLTEV